MYNTCKKDAFCSFINPSMGEATNDCLCCDSLKLSAILSKFEIFAWIGLFIANFFIQKDLKDPIWLASSIVIFIYLLFGTAGQIYALSSKNFCLVIFCGISRFFVTFGNLTVIVLTIFIEEMGNKDEM